MDTDNRKNRASQTGDDEGDTRERGRAESDTQISESRDAVLRGLPPIIIINEAKLRIGLRGRGTLIPTEEIPPFLYEDEVESYTCFKFDDDIKTIRLKHPSNPSETTHEVKVPSRFVFARKSQGIEIKQPPPIIVGGGGSVFIALNVPRLPDDIPPTPDIPNAGNFTWYRFELALRKAPILFDGEDELPIELKQSHKITFES
jgi:hypothetical protein